MSRLIHTGLNAGKGHIARVVGAKGVYFHLEDGRKVLDGSNTGGPIGHGHPLMIEAMKRAVGNAPAINEGWFWQDREDAAQDLIDIAFEGETYWIGGVRFFLSGSEANDAALSFAQAYTGRRALATRERAYHGMTGLSRHMTVQPHWHGGLAVYGGTSQPVPEVVPIKTIPAPVGAKYLDPKLTAPKPWDYCDPTNPLEDTAATIIDYTQGGRYYDAEYQDKVAKLAKDAGSLWIADEVITGLGRSGRWFAFQGAKSRPDMVVLGKPIAGGAAPGGAVVMSKALVDSLSGKSWNTYSTYRGHPIIVAAVRAYLRIAKSEGLLGRVEGLEKICAKRLVEIAERHPSVARVDGFGLHWTVELHGPNWKDWDGSSTASPMASQVAAEALKKGVMFGTSGEQTSIFIAPSLIIEEPQLEQVFDVLDEALKVADLAHAEPA